MELTNDRLIEIITEEVRRFGAQSAPAPVSAPAKAEASAPAYAAPTPVVQPCCTFVAPCKQVSQEPTDALRRMQAATAARIGIGRNGPRLTTDALLHFRADHAAARDAVTREVDEAFLERLGLFRVQSLCRDSNEYLTRPDLGRQLSPEAEETLKKACKHAPAVQIFAAGGLSSVAIQANLENIFPALTDSLSAKGISIGTPFYVQFGRVGVEDAVSVLLDAEVVCVLIGERPGLMTAESMSAYIAYRAVPDMPESRRTVISNIHKGGTGAAEAGAYIAEIIELIRKTKTSGVDLKR